MDYTCRLKILQPLDGDILNRNDGIQSNRELKLTVKGRAEPGKKIWVNGVEAKREGIHFEAQISINSHENRIVAMGEEPEVKDKITVFWDRNSVKRYRFSVDDNILFLADIARNADVYRSIFDNPYMAMWRQMHKEFKSKIHLNIYYQTEGFNLSQMPDKFKGEWKDNADWLRLTFHALQNDPDRPYINTTYDEIKHDCQLVTDEIVRFAGEELLSTFTTVHWGEATKEGCRALRDLGFKGLVGYFNVNNQRPLVSYYHDYDTTMHLNKRDYWKDTEEDIIFVKHDIVVNSCNAHEVIPHLQEVAKDPHQSEIMELLIHEQYFYPDYINYQPDFKDKVETAIRWATERGYKPVFYGEGFIGSP